MANKKKKASALIKRKAQPTQGGKGKSQRHEMDIRLDYVESLLASGLRYCQTVVVTMDKWNVCRKSAENYIARIYKKWREEEKEDRPLKKRRALERRRQVFVLAINKGDYSGANKALDTLERMEGVAVDVKLQIENTGNVSHEHTHEAGESLRDALREVMSDPGKRRALAKKLAPPREKVDAAPRHNTGRSKVRSR